MDKYRIIGERKPNRLKLKSLLKQRIIDLSRRKVRLMYEGGLLNIQNPEVLYERI